MKTHTNIKTNHYAGAQTLVDIITEQSGDGSWSWRVEHKGQSYVDYDFTSRAAAIEEARSFIRTTLNP